MTEQARKAGPSQPIPLGTIVKHWGKVAAVGYISGERYYWLVDKRGSVSMMPADTVESEP